LDIFFRGNLPGLPGEETKGKGSYLIFVQHWEGGTTKWESKCPVELKRIISWYFILLIIISFLY